MTHTIPLLKISAWLRTVTATVVLLALASDAGAGLGQWTPVGPPGGSGRAIVVDPIDTAKVYTIIDHSVFKSTDGGAGWSGAGSGLPAFFNPESFAIDPLAPNRLYVASSTQGVYVSTDSAGTWAASNTGLPSTAVAALAADPGTAGTVYVGVTGSVYKSTNGGASWSASGSGLGGAYLTSLAIDPVTPTTLYAGMYEPDVADPVLFKSTDGGANWNATSLSPASLGNHYTARVNQIVIDPIVPSTLYVVIADDGYLDHGPFIAKSTDGGTTFSRIGPGSVPYVLAIDPTNPARLVAGTTDGVFTSLDGAVTWTRTSVGLAAVRQRGVPGLAIDPSDPATVYAVLGSDGVYKTTDGAAHWASASLGLPRSSPALEVTLAPDASTRVYALSSSRGLLASTDAGAHWTAQNLELMVSSSPTSVVIDPVTPDTMYASDALGGVFKSVDRGTTWTPTTTGLGSPYVAAIVMDPTASSTLYAATAGGVFRSTDSAGSWSAASTGLTDLHVQSLAIDPTATTTLYAGTSAGVFKSIDAAATWTATALTLMSSPNVTDRQVRRVVIDPSAPQTLYASTFIQGYVPPVTLVVINDLKKSSDGGASWTTIETGFSSSNIPVFALAIDPATPTTLYAGSFDGVYRSLDAGANWAPFTTGLGAVSVRALAIDPLRPSWVYAATDAGLHRIEGACAVDADCEDGNPCTADTCNVGDGSCANGAVPDGSGCDDDDACSAASECSAGVCAALDPPPVCDDGVDCTDDLCAPQSGTCIAPLRPNGGLCDDGTTCTTEDQCSAGTCGGTAVLCEACLLCENGLGCIPKPKAGCLGPGARGGSLSLRETTSYWGGDKLKWKWKGSPVSKADFGTPTTSWYYLCLFDTSAGVARGLRLPGTDCMFGGCWKESGRGFKFQGNGLKLALSAATNGKGSITIVGKGLDFAPGGAQALPLTVDPKVVMQLQRSDAPMCWESEYTTSHLNTATRFEAKIP